MNVPINPHAPVLSKAEIVIEAPIEKVWQLLTNIDDWPAWQKEVTQANMEGPFQEGVIFKWKAGGLSFTSQIHTIEPRSKLGWTGKTLGVSAIHNWYFNAEGNNTRVKVEENLQGLLATLFKGSFQKNLDKGMQQNLMELKAVAEK